MVKEFYVSFEIAKLLKEKGFNEETREYYHIKGDATGRLMFGSEYPHNNSQVQISAPTQQMAMQWLREVHGIHIMVNCVGKVNYDPIIQCFDGKDFEVEGYEVGTTRTINGKTVNVRRGFRTYEEAVEAAIKYSLENLIQKTMKVNTAQEDKELLIKDLCARLPYGVYVKIRKPFGCVYKEEDVILTSDIIKQFIANDYIYIFPYLRPMSSMTEEECIELGNINATIENISEVIPNVPYYIEVAYSKQIDWLNSYHFDHRGLIPKGLALAASADMYNK